MSGKVIESPSLRNQERTWHYSFNLIFLRVGKRVVNVITGLAFTQEIRTYLLPYDHQHSKSEIFGTWQLVHIAISNRLFVEGKTNIKKIRNERRVHFQDWF